jgi:hypothetical protein
MPRPSNNDIEQDKLARFDRIRKAIAQLEKQQRQIVTQGELAPKAAWVARYQVRQNTKKYWYYKLQGTMIFRRGSAPVPAPNPFCKRSIQGISSPRPSIVFLFFEQCFQD